jgi:uncharacterized membrane protein (UPF0127 family)
MTAKKVTIRNLSKPLVSPLKVGLCNTFLLRLKGLMFVNSISTHSGILIDENHDSIMNTAIHMFFMNFDIAVVWINSQNKVVDSLLARPWRPIYAPKFPARYILEIHPNQLPEFTPGDLIAIENE